MIRVNLLPNEFRKQSDKKSPISLRFIMFLSCVGTLAIWISVVFMSGTAKVDHQNYMNEWNRIASQSLEADKIISYMNQNINERKKIISYILSMNSNWATVLNEISNQIPDTLWLTKIKLQTKEINVWEFLLKGMALPSDRVPSVKQIGTYVSDIKQVIESTMKVDEQYVSFIDPGVKVPQILEIETATDKELTEDVLVTLFQSWYTVEGAGEGQ